jgi:hypothetical protein
MSYPRVGMIDLLKLLSGFLVGLFGSQATREAEMAFLRQQLLVLQRSAPAGLRVRTADRLIFVWLYRLFPSLLEVAVIFQPETLMRWHRSGFRLYWRWKSRRRVGRPAVPADIRDLTRVPRPCPGVRRETPSPAVGELHDLLQRGAHASCAGQGYSAPLHSCSGAPMHFLSDVDTTVCTGSINDERQEVPRGPSGDRMATRVSVCPAAARRRGPG